MGYGASPPPAGTRQSYSVWFALHFDPAPAHIDLPRRMLLYALSKCAIRELARELGCSRPVARAIRNRAQSQLTAMEPSD